MKKFKSVNIKILALISLSFWSTIVNAQNLDDKIYETADGVIQIIGVLNDTVLIAESNEMVVVLNYETAEFFLTLDKSTLNTGNDSINNMLSKLKNDFLRYEGKLGVDFVKTEDHAPQDFEVEGYLTNQTHQIRIVGKGHLEHIYGDARACVLNMRFELHLADVGVNLGIEGLADEIQIETRQTVMKRDNR